MSCQNAAATQALGLQLDSLRFGERPARRETDSAPPALKRRTVEFVFDQASDETLWVHAFGLSAEIDGVIRCSPKAHLTSAAGVSEDASSEASVVSPEGRVARIAGSREPVAAGSPARLAERANLSAMLLASGWSWHDADDKVDH
jgi:hypothetical protein